MADASGYVWFTYRELAAHLNISLQAAEARARRHVRKRQWVLRRDNEGGKVARIGIPAADFANMLEAAERDARQDAPGYVRRDARQDAELREALIERARAEGERDALRSTLAHERQARAAAEAERDAAQREAAEWVAGGPLARAWRALIWRRGG